jgi:hypothetical protein
MRIAGIRVRAMLRFAVRLSRRSPFLAEGGVRERVAGSI